MVLHKPKQNNKRNRQEQIKIAKTKAKRFKYALNVLKMYKNLKIQ